jgi:cyclin-dependent kinase 2
VSRKDRREYAIRKARVYPGNEGVPYYMMRELAALKKIKNQHICELVTINLHDFNLHLLFPYIDKTLHDFMNPLGGPLSGNQLKKHQVISLTFQLLDAVNYCHKRGIVHRNLKPKHLLIIPGGGADPLDNAQLKLGESQAVIRHLSLPNHSHSFTLSAHRQPTSR